MYTSVYHDRDTIPYVANEGELYLIQFDAMGYTMNHFSSIPLPSLGSCKYTCNEDIDLQRVHLALASN